MARLDHLFELQQQHLKALLARRNVTGVGIGLRIRDGKATGEHVIGVTVDGKAQRGDLAAADLIPDTLEANVGGTVVRIATDIVEMRAAAPDMTTRASGGAPYQVHRRPLQSGYSLGSAAGTGTIGCFVSRGGRRHLLTNLHVMTPDVFAPQLTDAWQPGPRDHGDPKRDRIGRTASYVPFAAAPGTNLIDAALVELDATVPIDSNVPRIGRVDGWYHAMNLGWKASAVGATSGYVEAHCTNTAWFGLFPYRKLPKGQHTVIYSGLQLMHTFPNETNSQPGDSGMVWVTEDKKIALLNLGDNAILLKDAYGTPFGAVMQAFKASLIVTGGRGPGAASDDAVDAQAEGGETEAEERVADERVVGETPVADPDFSPEVWRRIAALSGRDIREV